MQIRTHNPLVLGSSPSGPAIKSVCYIARDKFNSLQGARLGQ